MTCKLSWITFIPFTLLAIASKVVSLYYLDENGLFMGLNALTLSYVAIACALIVLLFGAIFSFMDKKTAPVYVVKQNAPAGIFGLLLSVALACDGANRAFTLFKSGAYDFIEITDITLTVLCAVVFVVLALNHFVGNGGVKGISVFYLIPAIFSAFRLVSCFLEFTTISIMVADVTILACYIFATLFLFNYAMVVALMKGKSPVRSAFIYGMPAVTILLSFGTYHIMDTFRYGTSSFSLFESIEIFELALLGLYILAFIIEMSIFVKKKDEIEILGEDTEEGYEDIDDPDADIINALGNSVTNGNKPDKEVEGVVRKGFNSDHLAIDDEVFLEVAQASMNSYNEHETELDMDGFIYGSAASDEDFAMLVKPKADSDDDDDEQIVDESDDVFITDEDGTYYEEDEEKEIESEVIDDKLDRIDKLILEITEDDLD